MKINYKKILLIIGILCLFIKVNHNNNPFSKIIYGGLEIIQGITILVIFYLCIKLVFNISKSLKTKPNKKIKKNKYDVTDYQTDDDRNDDGFGTFNNEYGGYDHYDQDDSN
ncbi:hypothetical protein GSH19_04330 [Lactobacillus sp. S2-2]|uniref:hypothetical protein n=1 Tax=Lactobacillus sp. S2-2 TaxID=2692917 RepID=UPI001F1D2F21|nr:hypothetical protein [Lactobacillus sp. S2-2]MCF6515380.1 hypothetical protein [Lactobacillus sp. S2-2]